MNNNYNTVQPAFTANLVTNGIKLNPQKLKAVQERFSKLTQHYKDDTLTISARIIKGDDIIGGQSLHVADFNTANDNPASIADFKDFKKWFEVGSVEEIAKSLTRVFKSGKFYETQEPKIEGMKKLLNHVQLAASVNANKAQASHKPVYTVLAAKNLAKAEALKKDIQKAQEHTYDILERIQDYPIDAPIYWWHG